MDDIELGTIDYARDPPHPRESNAKSGACTRASKRVVDLLRARRVAKAYAPTLTGVLYRKKEASDSVKRSRQVCGSRFASVIVCVSDVSGTGFVFKFAGCTPCTNHATYEPTAAETGYWAVTTERSAAWRRTRRLSRAP